ncbi:Flp pilus assembly protein, ATPase CpaF [Burkholderia sp. Ch1-1]|uniref:Flp pilus assembly protein, ATPase CpaF n=1 Tax=Paraburkholderia dioscoreae TaxID=2604047 RepID=A0A5Q4YV79_9BURK|nr:ATPase, T2SS/T4P/T4SS family [Paraburkholderia dioscoreae]EIF35537.1 Flp pilus assembly protein, ATPase CpaF [Burkholderia sp. Ch1-1]VVD31435.1 Flp pilus assembly protein, ATPase CpaF [Paraburkholderia dioscoreae]
MLNLQVHARNAPVRALQVEQGCTIGKDASCDVIVKGLLIGKLQARIVREHNAYYIEDQGGIAATLVNGSPITRYGPLTEADQIEIGVTTIRIVRAAAAIQPAHQAVQHGQQFAQPSLVAAHGGHEALPDRPPLQAQASAQIEPSFAVAAQVPSSSEPSYPHAVAPDAASADQYTPVRRESMATPDQRAAEAPLRIQAAQVKKTAAAALPVAPINSPLGIELRKQAHMKVISALDLRRLNVARMEEDELRKTVGAALDDILNHDVSFQTADIPLSALKKSVFDEIIGLGPLEELIADPTVSEIMVNCHNEIFIEQNGQLTRSPVIFTDDRAVLGAIERIVAPIGRRIDESSPMVDARLSDGSRVNAVIPPLALKGPSITIRKFSRQKLGGEDLIRFGSMSADMLEFLHTAVKEGANIVISGGTGSGKTTLLNVLSSYIPDDERIVTVEDAAELQLSQPNLVSLEARPANMEGKGAIHIRDLVKNCLRMRPDRIVIGECRGGEALDMLQAMNTGHDGSLTTAHANTPRDCIARLEVMTLMAGLDLPVQAIREQICSAVDIIVQQSRFSCGSRRVTHVTEVSGMESGVITLQDVFVFKEEGFSEHGKIQGKFVPTAYVPDFYQELIRRRIPVNTDIFTRVE